MKILIVANSYPLSTTTGTWAPFWIRDLVLALSRAGADVLVLAPDHEGESEVEEGIIVRRIQWSGRDEMDIISLKLSTAGGLRRAASLFLNGRRQVSAVLQEFRPDFCLAAWALPSGGFARYGKKKYGVPYAVWCLGSDIHTWARKPVFRGITQRILEAADLRYDGFALAREAEALCRMPCDFLPTTRPLNSKSAEPVSFDPHQRHFLFVGRWERVKGLDILLDAWRNLVVEGHARNGLLHIVGQGQGLRPLVERAARDATLKGSVDVLGWVTKEHLAGLYAATDYVVIPSRKESIPVVFSEALSNAKPLIVTDVGDMGELLQKYQLGRLVPAESVESLQSALADCIEHGHMLDSEKLAAVRQLFDIDKTAQKFLSDVASVLSSPAPANGLGVSAEPPSSVDQHEQFCKAHGES